MTKTLKEDVKEKWLAALRSEEYEQCTGRLRIRDTNQYCCLGVLCDVYAKETGEGEWKEYNKHGLRLWDFHTKGDTKNKYLPDAVMDWACNLQSNDTLWVSLETFQELFPNVDVDTDDNIMCLAKINDETDIGFEGIALLIEKDL